MDVTSFLTETMKVIVPGVVGYFARFVYEKNFSRRPDLRYVFGAPSVFGAGTARRTYQNLVVQNEGTESAIDVRVAFRRPDEPGNFFEYQVVFDGEYREERQDERLVIVIPSLPPSDSLTVSFVMHPDTHHAQDLAISVRANNCLGRRGARARVSLWDYFNVVMGVTAIALIGFTVGGMLLSSATPLRETGRPKAEQEATPRTPKTATVSLQVLEAAAKGQAVTVDVFLDNQSDNPVVGMLRGWVPWGAGGTYERQISVSGGKRFADRWTVKIPADLSPGRYRVDARFEGQGFEGWISERGSTSLEVR